MLFPPAPLPYSPEALLRTGETLWEVSRSGRRPDGASRQGPSKTPMFSDHQQVRAVSITELDRIAAAVLAEVARGTRVIVTKHGMPSALIVSIRDGAEVMLAGSESFALLRREAHEQLAAGETTELARWRPKVSRSG